MPIHALGNSEPPRRSSAFNHGLNNRQYFCLTTAKRDQAFGSWCNLLHECLEISQLTDGGVINGDNHIATTQTGLSFFAGTSRPHTRDHHSVGIRVLAGKRHLNGDVLRCDSPRINDRLIAEILL